NGVPFETITVENPDASPSIYNRLRITKTTATGPTVVSEYDWSSSLNRWVLTTGNGLRTESLTTAWNSSGFKRIDTRVVTDANGAVVSKTADYWQSFAWGSNMVMRIVDPDGAALTNLWFYHDEVSPTDPNYAQLRMKVTPTGYWEYYQYSDVGVVTNMVAQFLDTPTNVLANAASINSSCRVTTTTYTNFDPEVATSVNVLGQEIARSYIVSNVSQRVDIQCQSPGASISTADNLSTTTIVYTAGSTSNQVASIRRPDSTLTLYGYLIPSDGSAKTITNNTGATGG